MLFSPVYIEAHPHRSTLFVSRIGLRGAALASRTNLRDAARTAPRISANSFTFHPFRTLASHLKAAASSNSFEINRFRTLCKTPGIGYPLSPFVTRHSPLFIHPLYFQSFPDSCHTMERRNPCVFRRFRTLSIAMGVYTPSPRAFSAKGLSCTQSVIREGYPVRFRRRGLVLIEYPSRSSLSRDQSDAGDSTQFGAFVLALHQSPACPERSRGVTNHQSRITSHLFSLSRTIAPKTPRCQNALERSSNATPGNISARPGV
jgi:hypothetical protein